MLLKPRLSCLECPLLQGKSEQVSNLGSLIDCNILGSLSKPWAMVCSKMR